MIDVITLLSAVTSFFLLGRYVGETRAGVGLFAYAVAGLAVLRLAVVLPRVLTTFASELAGGSLELVLSSPRRATAVIAGSAAYEMLRGLVMAGALLVLAWTVFGLAPPPRAAGVLAVAAGLVGAAALMLGLAVLGAGLLMVVRQAGAIGSFVTVTLPLVAGAYFPVALLPQPLESVATVLPFHFAVELVREGLLAGRFSVPDAALLVLGAAVELLVAFGVLRAGVERARRAGTLSID